MTIVFVDGTGLNATQLNSMFTQKLDTSSSVPLNLTGSGTQLIVADTAQVQNLTVLGNTVFPTKAAGNNTTSVATTAFVQAAISLSGAYNPAAVEITGGTLAGVSGAFTALTAPTLTLGDNTTGVATTAFVTAGFAPLASPVLTGTPTAPTQTSGNNTTRLATTAFVQNAVVAAGTYVASAVVITGGSINGTTIGATTPSTGAFTTLTGPTRSANDSTTNVATTAFVVGQAGTASPASGGTAAIGTSLLYARQDHAHPSDTSNVGTATPLMNGSAAVGTSLLYARQDHVHASDTSRAALASPTFTGTPAAPTATGGTNTTQLATTAFVQTGLTQLAVRVFTTTGGTTVAATDTVLVIKKGTGAATGVTLQASPPTGRWVTIKDGKGDSTTNNITVTPAAGTIDGASSFVIAQNYAAVTFLYDGTSWGVV